MIKDIHRMNNQTVKIILHVLDWSIDLAYQWQGQFLPDDPALETYNIRLKHAQQIQKEFIDEYAYRIEQKQNRKRIRKHVKKPAKTKV